MSQVNKIRPSVLLGLLAIVSFTPLFAEPRAMIELTVIDEKTNKPFPNVKISGTIEDETGKKSTLAEKNTDVRGQYQEFVTSNGKFTLTVTAPGYQPEKVEGQIKGTDVRVSRRVRSKIVLKKVVVKKEGSETVPVIQSSSPKSTSTTDETAAKLEPVAKSEGKGKDESKGRTAEPAVKPISSEEVLSQSEWDEKTFQSTVMDAIFYGDVYLGVPAAKFRSASISIQESFLMGLLMMIKQYAASDGFIQSYLEKRKELHKLESDAEDENLPRSARDLLKKKLQKFLDESATVDFSAKTEEKSGVVYFVEEDNERKSALWKKCFRAGPRLTKIARDFAESWLVSLNQ